MPQGTWSWPWLAGIAGLGVQGIGQWFLHRLSPEELCWTFRDETNQMMEACTCMHLQTALS